MRCGLWGCHGLPGIDVCNSEWLELRNEAEPRAQLSALLENQHQLCPCRMWTTTWALQSTSSPRASRVGGEFNACAALLWTLLLLDPAVPLAPEESAPPHRPN